MKGYKNRQLGAKIEVWTRQYPVVTVTGPRQSGKTTLVRELFPDYGYANLENPVERDFALSDAVAFLDGFPGGVVIDEIQRVPSLLSHIQARVDARPEERGRYILTGSNNLQLMHGVFQSLAGRTALGTLLPFSYAELAGDAPSNLWEALWRGFFPRVVHDKLDPAEAMAFYTATYLERDVRELVRVKDLTRFSLFLRLAAGRTGQLLNATNLAADCGIASKTALEWISILEAGYILRRLPPWFANVTKRLSKTPKLYFLDTGLVCYLLGISTPGQLATHPLRGAIFETFVMNEFWKHVCNTGKPDRLFHYRDGSQRKIDLVDETAPVRRLVEVKSGQTPSQDWFETLAKASGAIPGESELAVVYGGKSPQTRNGIRLIPWTAIADFIAAT